MERHRVGICADRQVDIPRAFLLGWYILRAERGGFFTVFLDLPVPKPHTKFKFFVVFLK